MGTSLFDALILTNATPGVAWLATTNPQADGNNVNVVFGTVTASAALEQIDTIYVASGAEAYVTLIHCTTNGRLLFRTNPSPTGTSGSPGGPQLTEAAEDNFVLALRISGGTGDGDVYSWSLADLDASDETEPYDFSAASVTAAGHYNQ